MTYHVEGDVSSTPEVTMLSYEDLLRETMDVIADGTRVAMKHLFKNGDGKYVSRMDNWTGRYRLKDGYEGMDPGYLAGRLWLLYLHTSDEDFKKWALQTVEPMIPDLTKRRFTARASGVDIYYGLCWAADITSSEALRQKGLEAVDNFIASIWQPEAKAFYSKPGGRHVNIDAVLSLFAMPWAARYKPEYLEHFIAHNDTVLKIGLVRQDGSTFQACIFDEQHEPWYLITTQGWRTQSTWARGQSWAMQNFAAAYAATGEQRFLEAAAKTCDWWVDNAPDDWVPYYDFNDPERFSKPRDSCAAAIAVGALVQMARYEPSRATKYLDVAQNTTQALSDRYMTDSGLILHGTWGNAVGQWGRSLRFPQEDVMPYANYYFVEALYRQIHDDWGIFQLRPS